MSKNAAEAIVLVALIALPALASLYATQPAPSTSSLNLSPQPIHSTHPMVPAPPGPSPQISSAKKAEGCTLPAAQCWASINWGGYAITNATDSVTFVSGSWTVPAIVGAVGPKCPDTQVTWFDASTWVGIDGFSNGYVEQTGTSSDCYYGQVQYYPWYEFFPAPSYSLPSADKIYPGDTMYAYVNYKASSSLFGIWLQDMTAHHEWTFSLTEANPGAPMDSAEWITETAAACIPPTTCVDFEFLALTQFTSVRFSGGSATVVCPACVVPGTYTLPLSSPHWGASLQWILLVNLNWPSTPGVKAMTSAISKQDSFDVTFVSSGP
jgi:hypothetical protein